MQTVDDQGERLTANRRWTRANRDRDQGRPNDQTEVRLRVLSLGPDRGHRQQEWDMRNANLQELVLRLGRAEVAGQKTEIAVLDPVLPRAALDPGEQRL